MTDSVGTILMAVVAAAAAAVAAGLLVVSIREHWTKVQDCQTLTTNNFPWFV